ncbi:nitrate reductase [Trichoderma arundinaceum]|uniref:Nitrate reductase [NADPH] n=1 Tax=Trichoderma arundinaceum TaxID=490622 RepID=A0A395N9X5_TRIAR|nr:nitrate reductase [Trichoderma arundinaceum]
MLSNQSSSPESHSESEDDLSCSFTSSSGSSLITKSEECSPCFMARQTAHNVHGSLSDAFTHYDDALLPTIPKTEPIEPLSTDNQTPDHWIARDSRMIRLTGKHPCNVEAPLSTLFKAGFLTPQNLFYVRSHGETPRISMKQGQEWRLRVHGLVENEMEFSIQDLKEIFQVITLPVTLVCAGNRRKEQNMVSKGLGFNWGAAGISTGLFTGVYLADILNYCKPTNPLLSSHPSYDKIIPGRARHVIFEGADELPRGRYGTSQRLSWAIDRSKGMIIAWALNGEDLSPDHGYPLRLVVPGQIGGRMVKWLQRIEISDHESQHYLHYFDNKLLPTTVAAEQARNEDKWWLDPKYIINELNVNAAICSPAHGDIIEVASGHPLPQTTLIEGYAYTGGGRRITRVEVTLDDGKNWKLCDIIYPEDLYRINPINNHPFFGKLDLTETDMSFSWCFWKLQIDVDSLLLDENVEFIAVRAMDEALSIMPRDMYWNATSMMNSWWFRVAVHRGSSGRALRFEHPTLAGNAHGGWMQRMNEAGSDPRYPQLGSNGYFKAASPGFGTEPDKSQYAQTEGVIQNFMISPVKVSKIITAAELAKHADGDNQSPWFVVHGHVYDGTDFLLDHPGGDQSIRLVAGEDATEDFMAIHSLDAKKLLRKYHIGKLEELADVPRSPTPRIDIKDDPSKPFLEPNTWKKVRLVYKRDISHDTRIFRFALSHDDQILGLPIGQHVYLRLKTTNSETGEVDIVQRAYTPYSCSTQHGFIDLLIKVYFPSKEASQKQTPFVGGKMTMLLDKMTADMENDMNLSVELKGPIGDFTYMGNGKVRWKLNNRIGPIKKLVMIAGGSGITPIWSTLKAIRDEYTMCPQARQRNPIQIWFIYGNRAEEDILIREEIDHIKHEMDGYLHIWHVLSSNTVRASWEMGRGHIDLKCLQQHIPPAPFNSTDVYIDTLALVCGPSAMEKCVSTSLQELGWNIGKNVVFF